MIIEVTQSDIDGGTPRDSGKCPITLAAQRVFPNKVTTGVVFIFERTGPCGYVTYRLPKEATDFVGKFDKGLPVEPLTFEIGEANDPC